MQSASVSYSRASVSWVASTPRGSTPQISPASRPALVSEWTQSPASSRSGCSAMAGTAWMPTVPVAHWITRYVMVVPLVDVASTVAGGSDDPSGRTDDRRGSAGSDRDDGGAGA